MIRLLPTLVLGLLIQIAAAHATEGAPSHKAADLSPDVPPVVWRVLGFISGLMRPAFPA